MRAASRFEAVALESDQKTTFMFGRPISENHAVSEDVEAPGRNPIK